MKPGKVGGVRHGFWALPSIRGCLLPRFLARGFQAIRLGERAWVLKLLDLIFYTKILQLLRLIPECLPTSLFAHFS